MVKQSLNESISDFGRSIIEMVNKLFPSVNECKDIDKIMQERFAEGLSDKKLREKVRSKMLKMRNITKDENFKILDLIKYAECKMASFDEDTVDTTKFGTTSDSDAQHEHSHSGSTENAHV